MRQEEKKCACKGGNLERFIQPIILQILMDGPETGYGIFKKMEDFSMFRKDKPDVTGVYRYLRVMETRGLLLKFESREGENKYKMKYRITKEGRECLANWRETLSEYAESIMDLVSKIDRSV